MPDCRLTEGVLRCRVGPYLTLCTRRPGGLHSPEDSVETRRLVLVEVDLGAPREYASLMGPVGGHSIDLLECGLITEFFRGLVNPGLLLVAWLSTACPLLHSLNNKWGETADSSRVLKCTTRASPQAKYFLGLYLHLGRTVLLSFHQGGPNISRLWNRRADCTSSLEPDGVVPRRSQIE